MNAAAKRQPLTFAAYRELIAPRPDHERWELLDGEAVLMAPSTQKHQRIVANLLSFIAVALRAKHPECWVSPGLAVFSAERDDFSPMPDVAILCGPSKREDGYADDPVFVAEVLSPSTMNNDRGRKAEFYLELASLRHFALVYPDEMRVELWRRGEKGWTLGVLSGPDDAIALDPLYVRLALAEVYEGVTLPTARRT